MLITGTLGLQRAFQARLQSVPFCGHDRDILHKCCILGLELRGSELLRWWPDGSVAPVAPRPYGARMADGAADGAANGATVGPTVVSSGRAQGQGAMRWLLGGAAVCGALLVLVRWHSTGGSATLRLLRTQFEPAEKSYQFSSLRGGEL